MLRFPIICNTVFLLLCRKRNCLQCCMWSGACCFFSVCPWTPFIHRNISFWLGQWFSLFIVSCDMPGINEKGATSDVCHNCVCEKECVDGRVLKKLIYAYLNILQLQNRYPSNSVLLKESKQKCYQIEKL